MITSHLSPALIFIYFYLLSPYCPTHTESYYLEESLGILLQTGIYLFIKMIPVLIIHVCLPADHSAYRCSLRLTFCKTAARCLAFQCVSASSILFQRRILENAIQIHLSVVVVLPSNRRWQTGRGVLRSPNIARAAGTAPCNIARLPSSLPDSSW